MEYDVGIRKHNWNWQHIKYNVTAVLAPPPDTAVTASAVTNLVEDAEPTDEELEARIKESLAKEVFCWFRLSSA
jgi:hypothetical protein